MDVAEFGTKSIFIIQITRDVAGLGLEEFSWVF